MSEIKIAPDNEAVAGKQASLVAPDAGEIGDDFPSDPSAGHGHCHKGLCYGSCGDGWMRLVDKTGAKPRHLSCTEARRDRWWYMCGETKYFSVC